MVRIPFHLLGAAVAALAGVAVLSAAQSVSAAGANPSQSGDDTKPRTAEVGKPAPDFKLTDLGGKEVKLSEFKDKIVVLEWFNPGCPVVQRHHGKDELKSLGNEMTKDGVVWLAINSSAAGKEGAGAEANQKAAEKWALRHPVLLDEKGEVGRLYGAKTTPHMYVIDAKGVLAYAGAIDDDPSGQKESSARVNYVRDAVTALKKGEAVKTPSTKPYGCGVKY